MADVGLLSRRVSVLDERSEPTMGGGWSELFGLAPRHALLADYSRPARTSDGLVCVQLVGDSVTGVGGFNCDPLHLNVAGAFCIDFGQLDQMRALGLQAGSMDDSISGGSIGPTAKSGPHQTPLFGFLSLQRFPVSSACA